MRRSGRLPDGPRRARTYRDARTLSFRIDLKEMARKFATGRSPAARGSSFRPPAPFDGGECPTKGARVRETFGGIRSAWRARSPAHVGADRQRRFANLHRFAFHYAPSLEANSEKNRAAHGVVGESAHVRRPDIQSMTFVFRRISEPAADLRAGFDQGETNAVTGAFQEIARPSAHRSRRLPRWQSSTQLSPSIASANRARRASPLIV